MSEVLLVQISAFGNKRIKPEPGIITALMQELIKLTNREFLPSVIPVPKLVVGEQKIALISNLTFATADNSCQILCVDKRIDCAFNLDKKEQDSIEEKCRLGAQIVSYIMKQSDVIANRLALNVNYDSNACNGSTKFERQIIKVTSYYKKKRIVEWGNRVNGQTTVKIDGRDELLNVVTSYNCNRYKLPKDAEMKVNCNADINTVAENNDYRFKYDCMESFTLQAKQIFDKLYEDIEVLTNDSV